MDFEKYTERARGFLQSAQGLALREGHQRFLPEHVLKVLLDDSEGLAANLIQAAGGNPRAALQGTEQLLRRQPKVEGSGAGQVYLAPETARLFDAAQKVAQKAGDSFVTVERLLLAIADADGYFKRLSPAVLELLGYTVEEALKIPYLEMIHPDDRGRAMEAVRLQMIKGERLDGFVGRFRHKDGSWRTLSWRSMPRGNLMFATARDVSEDARAAEELREAKQQLESRVAERTRALADGARFRCFSARYRFGGCPQPHAHGLRAATDSWPPAEQCARAPARRGRRLRRVPAWWCRDREP